MNEPNYEAIAAKLSEEQGEVITADYLRELDARTEADWLATEEKKS